MSPEAAAAASANVTGLLMYGTAKQHDRSRFPWHESIEKLWTTKWEPLVRIGAYPFDRWSQHSDFEAIMTSLATKHAGVSANDFDEDEWASHFLEPGAAILRQAQEYDAQGEREKAIETYLRSAAVFRIGTYPWFGHTSRSQAKAKTWQLDKLAYESAMRLDEYRFETVDIPFNNAPPCSSALVIPAYVTAPKPPAKSTRVILIIGGLDLYKTGPLQMISEVCDMGYTVVHVDMPGTGDCPITGKGTEDDRALWKSILDWIDEQKGPRGWSEEGIYAWGLSSGAYHSVKLSRYERQRVKEVLVHGTASHYTFNADWLESADHLYYSVAYWSSIAKAFGYHDKHEFARECQRYSLLNQGLLDRPGTRLTVINGIEDSVVPIDDSILLSSRGTGATLLLFAGEDHMGLPSAEPFLKTFWRSRLT
ncbi:uncharacterized protein PFL1_06114 [Pseudozyma flocculosa PF-1]|uniref:Uncharacterized protein n=1 Tax=Pseudozyma flocculosa PF-1 TaxID=1277687 RepID=A0A061H7A4_9BASI|nr:uncharacterized protein PFL1_06114 [Pseudozyma flocculosa PF-1]EPQ26466.1 hypothetical protein PFL1_06114 [Pseudozyma flocculosa PF-1]